MITVTQPRPITKKQIAEQIRQIVRDTPLNTPLRERDHAFMRGVFEGHPNWARKEGIGVRHVVVRENRQPGRNLTYGFWLIRNDGSEIDISWVESLYPSSHEKKVKAAMREAVSNQSMRYRYGYVERTANEDGEFPCESCGTWLCSDTEADVDHMPPGFVGVLEAFLREQVLAYSDIALDESCEEDTKDKLKDEKLAKDWQKWHREKAHLWLVCKPCHKRLTAARKKTA